MASQNIARLGIVLGVDSGELVTKISEAQQKFGEFKRQIKRDSEDAAKEIVRLEAATRNYGKSLTELEKIEEQIRLGKYKNQPDILVNNLKAQAAAYDKVAASAKLAAQAELDARLKKGGMTAQQSAALGYQTTDVITSLAGGQNPLMVLLQQGGQLRDQFGGFKPLFEGISSVVTLSRVAFVGLGAAIGGVALAMYKGSEEANKFYNTMQLTGNFAGVSIEKFNNLSRALSDKYNVAIGDSRDLMQTLVGTGQFTEKSMEAVASAITKVASLSGQTSSEVAKSLIPSLDGSASSAKKLNEQYHFLTLAQYKHIEALNEQGKAQEAIRFTSDALAKKLDEQATKLGYLERLWKGLKNAASEFWDFLKGIGREDPAKEIKALELQMENAMNGVAYRSGNTKFFDALKEKRDRLKSQLQKETEKVKADSEAAEKTQQQIKDREAAGGFSTERKLAQERAKIIADINYQEAAEGLDRIEQLKLKRDRDMENVRTKLKNESPSTLRAFGWQMEKNAILETWRIQSQYEKDVQAISDEQKKKWADKAVAEEDLIAKERERLVFLKENMFATKEEIDLDNSRLKVKQELAALDRERNMLPADKEAAAKRIQAIGEEREGLIRQQEELTRLQNINQTVFSNMSSAIENFTRTGKLSFADLTKSIIQDLIAIQMKAQAVAMFSGMMKIFGGGWQGNAARGVDAGGYTSSLAEFADGGDPPVGVPSIVGERGPELFVPRSAGTIIPNDKLASSLGGNKTVNNFTINAIDTKSFEQRLFNSSNAIWAANQYANKSLAAVGGRS